jgi:hypothetical protein
VIQLGDDSTIAVSNRVEDTMGAEAAELSTPNGLWGVETWRVALTHRAHLGQCPGMSPERRASVSRMSWVPSVHGFRPTKQSAAEEEPRSKRA